MITVNVELDTETPITMEYVSKFGKPTTDYGAMRMYSIDDKRELSMLVNLRLDSNNIMKYNFQLLKSGVNYIVETEEEVEYLIKNL